MKTPRTGQTGWRLTRRGRRAVVGTAASVLLTGVFLVSDGLNGGEGPPQPPPAAAVSASGRSGQSGQSGPSGAPAPQAGPARSGTAAPPQQPALPPSRPLGVRIPSIGVDAPLMNVGLDKDGWVDAPPPQERNLAGWYRGSPTPGSAGTAVLVGHVDNRTGPAVFFSLGGLRKGSTVEVARKDGTTAVFSVYGVEVFDKDAFPTRRVYDDIGRPELRLITCGGRYTAATGYTGNVVVFARMVSAR